MIGLMENTYLISIINVSIVLINFILAYRSFRKFQLSGRIGKKYLSLFFSSISLAYFFVFAKTIFPLFEMFFWLLSLAFIFSAIAFTLILVIAISAQKHLTKIKITATTLAILTFIITVFFDLQNIGQSASIITSKASRNAFLFSANFAIISGALFFFHIRMIKHLDSITRKKFNEYKARISLGTLGIMGIWILLYFDFTGLLNQISLPIKTSIGLFSITIYWGIAMPKILKKLFD